MVEKNVENELAVPVAGKEGSRGVVNAGARVVGVENELEAKERVCLCAWKGNHETDARVHVKAVEEARNEEVGVERAVDHEENGSYENVDDVVCYNSDKFYCDQLNKIYSYKCNFK